MEIFRLHTVLCYLVVLMMAGQVCGETFNQNAIREGLQILSEPGSEPGEVVVTCYFIFRDKPSSFFYDIREGDKTLLFEFNDTKRGTAPIPVITEPPIASFKVEERRVDVNREIRGLNPEWHDQLVAVFTLQHVPHIRVSEEYNIISFSYRWHTDPSRQADYIVKRKRSPVLPLSLTAAGVGGGFILYYVLKPRPESPEDLPLSISDLPERGTPQ